MTEMPTSPKRTLFVQRIRSACSKSTTVVVALAVLLVSFFSRTAAANNVALDRSLAQTGAAVGVPVPGEATMMLDAGMCDRRAASVRARLDSSGDARFSEGVVVTEEESLPPAPCLGAGLCDARGATVDAPPPPLDGDRGSIQNNCEDERGSSFESSRGTRENRESGAAFPHAKLPGLWNLGPPDSVRVLVQKTSPVRHVGFQRALDRPPR